MHISLSTVMMAVLTTSLLLTLVSLCLINQEIMVRVGYKLLAVFVLFTVLRFALPFEFPFTGNVKLPQPFSMLITEGHRRLFLIVGQPVSFWLFLAYIWLIGAVCCILWYVVSYFRARYYIVLYGKELTQMAPYQEIVVRICHELNRTSHFRVIELPGLKVPMLFGIFRPKILLPEHIQLTEDQLCYVLQHEMYHHFHHDLLLKSVIKIITLIYWWNPLCLLLNRQTELILEMHVDDDLTQSNPDYTSEYMHCLFNYVTDATKKAPIPSGFTMGLLPKGKSDINNRFKLMANNQKRYNILLSVLICGIAIIIYLSSYTFILEAFNPPENSDTMSYSAPDGLYIPSEENCYFIENDDGTYDLYIGGIRRETLDSTEYYLPGVPIYTPDTCPYPIEQ